MAPRTALTVQERTLYSTLRRLLNEPGLIRGSLVEMRRVCGKATCACATAPARRHRSLYLGLSVRGRRRMVYIPPAWEARVRRWTAHDAEIRTVLAQLSEHYVQRVQRRAE